MKELLSEAISDLRLELTHYREYVTYLEDVLLEFRDGFMMGLRFENPSDAITFPRESSNV